MSSPDLHTGWAELFVASLASAGVQSAVLSPGSRSTPLALALARQARITTHVIVDERAAAFFALGQARVSGRPTVLLCTSGSAGGHYLPALIEATQSHLPMVVLTADRPWEAYDAAASQTIDQVKLFGDYVRHYAELGLPDARPGALAAVVRIATQAVAYSLAPQPGPVHVNARFRKPLEPVGSPHEEPFHAELAARLASGAPRVFSARVTPDTPVDAEALRSLALLCRERPRGLIVAGPAWAGSDPEVLRQAVARLQAVTGYAVFAEATSGLRFGAGPTVFGGLDVLFRPLAGRAGQRPELLPQLILELGTPPVSASYSAFLASFGAAAGVRAVIAAHGWNDPDGRADLLVQAEPATVCQALAEHPLLGGDGRGGLADAGERATFVAALAAADSQVWDAVEAECADEVFSEGRVVRELLAALPAGATLLLGNSLAVREVDTFCPPAGKPLRVLHQRGAAGIDGLVAGAAGTRSLSESPLALLLGDLSALHDLGGLATLCQVRGSLLVVVVNNAGGRIFEQLPVAGSPLAAPLFERLFLAPQPVDFVAAAASFGVAASRVGDRTALRAALQGGLAAERPLVIEAVVPPSDGKERRARIVERVTAQLSRSDLLAPAATVQAPAVRIDREPATVFLHGFLGGPDTWHELQRRLPGPSFAPFLPGHGPDPRCAGEHFDAVIASLAETLPTPRFRLVGYSLGARLALALALRFPERVDSLLLIGVDPGFPDEAQPERQARQAFEDQLCAQLASSPLEAFVDAWERLPLFASQRTLSPALQRRQRQTRLQHRPEGLIFSLRTLGTGRMPNLWARLPALRCPTRVVSGARDEKFTRIGQALVARRPDIPHIVLPHVGHNAVLEAPDAIYHLLRTPHAYSPR